MTIFARAKRVSDPLDYRVRAQLRGDDHGYSSSSGSEHAAGDDPSCFSGLLHGFLETTGSAPSDDLPVDSGDGSSEEDDSASRSAEIADSIRRSLDPTGKENGLRVRILSDVIAAADSITGLRSDKPGYKRAVMAKLRELGYNAGLCKSRWERSGRLAAGGHEYIDVEVAGEGIRPVRYVVDLGFKGEFEIARATGEYERVAMALPEVVVATADEVREVVRGVAEAARRSMRGSGLSVPPWRKSRYMMAKWLGPYRRTVNAVGEKERKGMDVMIGWRRVGFPASEMGNWLPATRCR